LTQTVFAHVRSRLVAGILLILPLLITLWIVRLLFSFIDGNVTPWVIRILVVTGLSERLHVDVRYLAPLIGVTLTLAVVYLFGLLAGNLVGRRVFAVVEASILRVPLVKGIYGSARQLLDSLSATGKGSFSRVVMIEWPKAGVFSLGFVTSDRALPLPGGDPGDPTVAVFLPTTPNPTSGWLALVRERDVVAVDMTVEEAIKGIVSGGIVLPERVRGGPR
jgi:uncharacterized membrane protein